MLSTLLTVVAALAVLAIVRIFWPWLLIGFFVVLVPFVVYATLFLFLAITQASESNQAFAIGLSLVGAAVMSVLPIVAAMREP